jgi:hypothetical protein
MWFSQGKPAAERRDVEGAERANRIAVQTDVLKREGEAHEKRIAARTKNIDARTDVVKREGEANEKRIAAETRRIAIESDSLAFSLGVHRTFAFAAVLGFTTLALNYLARDSRIIMKWRMLRYLRSGAYSPGIASSTHETAFRSVPFVFGRTPQIIVGTSGVGKSELLLRAARSAAARRVGPAGISTPVIYWPLRSTPEHNLAPHGGSASDARVAPSVGLPSAAARLFREVGLPVHGSLIGTALARLGWMLLRLRVRSVDAELLLDHRARDRLMLCLTVLFDDVLPTLYAERLARGLSPHDAAAKMVVDEMHDLFSDERLGPAGGGMLFNLLVSKFVICGGDAGIVHCIAAASSSEIIKDLNSSNVAQEKRWAVIEITDPRPRPLISALEGAGYSGTDARRLVAVCGARLRWVMRAVRAGPLHLSARTLEGTLSASAKAQFSRLLQRVGEGGEGGAARVAALCSALDTVAAAGWPQLPATSPNSSPAYDAVLPRGVSVGQVAAVLFLRPGSQLGFQSKLHHDVWGRHGATLRRQWQ